jgi:hypothetical protein
MNLFFKARARAKPPQPKRPRRASPPKEIQLLLPVWGRGYVKQFLDSGLPTLLAPGNLPALAASLPCTFIFLTSSEDADTLRDHPGIRYLRSFCNVEVRLIDDLITGDNHSTTITLAYARAVQTTGSAMLDTCFFFLISDYLVADGSLANVFARMKAGASAVLTGNFQVVEEDASPSFFARFDHGGAELAIPPRELMSWALAYLHPVTAANTVNFPLVHNGQPNRLFWHVDENTILGRFFLMHMICIRPETTTFSIGSSCDYSFVPAMCPSDNVEVITDSDEFLVVEMQPREHEREFVRLGPQDAPAVARSLLEWVTERHRLNSRFELLFHAADPPASLAAVAKEAEAFVAEVQLYLGEESQPFENHPYWIGAIVGHRLTLSQKEGREASPSSIYREYGLRLNFTQRLRDVLFGRPPNVRPWHPRWPDYQLIRRETRKLLGSRDRRILVVSKAPFAFGSWLKGIASEVVSLETRRLLALPPAEYTPLTGRFDACLIILGESEVRQAHALMKRIRPLLADRGFVGMLGLNGRAVATSRDFANFLTRYCGTFLGLRAPIDDIRFIRTGILRTRAIEGMMWIYRNMLRWPYAYYPVAVLLGPYLLLRCLVGNVLNLHFRTQPPRDSVPSSIWMVLRPPRGQEDALPDFSGQRERDVRGSRYRSVARPVLQPAASGERG